MERSEARRQSEQPPPVAEEEVAAAIAALLAGVVAVATVEALISGIARLLSLLPGVSESGGEGSGAAAVARLVVRDRPRLMGASGTLRSAYVDNLLHRAHYAVNAVKRLVASEDLNKGLENERRHFAAHREAERRRTAGARMVDAAVELHGPVLGWKHGHPEEPRPTHAAADGQNFDARKVPVSTGALPGVLPGCTCVPTVPFDNARMLT